MKTVEIFSINNTIGFLNVQEMNMQIIDRISELGNMPKGSSLTIGNFDGLHAGHAQILSTAKKIAADKNTSLVVMTFEPHPVAILHPEKAPERLLTLKMKLHLLSQHGADFVVLLTDDKEFLNLSATDFVDKFLIRNLQPGVVVEGENFHFGSGRSGNINTLTFLGAEKGFEVVIVEPQTKSLSIGSSIKVSSTLIRNLLSEGKAADAAVALTRPYKLIGQVTTGKGKGKRLGFPTANLANINQLIPAQGVYAGKVRTVDSEDDICRLDAQIPAVFSVGTTKTYGDQHPLLVEAHFLDGNPGDLTGKWMAMDFVKKIRAQQKFDSEESLAAQIANDCRKAKEILLQSNI